MLEKDGRSKRQGGRLHTGAGGDHHEHCPDRRSDRVRRHDRRHFPQQGTGFGKYTTSALLLTLILFVTAVALVQGKVEWTPIANILFAVAGFAGRLIAARCAE